MPEEEQISAAASLHITLMQKTVGLFAKTHGSKRRIWTISHLKAI
jgi:hypothetical protein